MTVHNSYQQPGGEDQVFLAESALLESYGHRVVRFTAHNDQITRMNRLAVARDTLWNSGIYRELRAVIRQERPQVVHFHNTFPLMSPAGYYAARAEGVPVVQTLHNYRLLCPNALFFRDGGVCEDCLGKAVPWPGIVHKCYRGSRAASGVVAAMLTTHNFLHTWTDKVDVYIALTEFARRKFVEGGIPEEKLMVKSNFVYPDPGPGEGHGGYALFVGRLSPEKGIDTLLAAYQYLDGRSPLKVVGGGPLSQKVAKAADRDPYIEYLGYRPPEDVLDLMKEASIFVLPSEWYEPFGRVVTEAFATATPVVAAAVGGVTELVEHGRTGLHFRPGDKQDLAAQIRWFYSHPEEHARMRRQARVEYESKYTAQRNYEMLLGIYRSALERHEVPA